MWKNVVFVLTLFVIGSYILFTELCLFDRVTVYCGRTLLSATLRAGLFSILVNWYVVNNVTY